MGQGKDSSWSMKRALLLGALLGALAAFLVPRAGDTAREPFVRELGDTSVTKDMETDLYTRTNVRAPSATAGASLACWLYLPKTTADGQRPPIIVMAHGLGGQRDFGLHKYGDAFASAGFAVLVFDYRGFGGSDGEPRHIASPAMQLEDWEAAVRFAQGPELRGSVDGSRLMLWGTSYSGGHVLVTASKLGGQVKAVVSQVPHLSGRAASTRTTRTRGLSASARLLMSGIADKLASLAGQPPMYVKLAGSPGEVAFMALSPTELQAYYAKHPAHKQGGWKNMIAARFVLDAPRYSPIDHVAGIQAPVLFVSAAHDSVCPHEVVEQAAALAPRAELATFACDHFSLYLDTHWAASVGQQLDFFRKHAAGPAQEGQQQ